MRCWKCGKEIDEGVKFCPFCGTKQERRTPATETGRAMRAVCNRHSVDEVLSDSGVLTGELGTYLDDTQALCSRIEMAMDAGLGQLYQHQITLGEPDIRFHREAVALLTEKAGLSESVAGELANDFNDMLGWPRFQTESKPVVKAAQPEQRQAAPAQAVTSPRVATEEQRRQSVKDAKSLRRKIFWARLAATFGFVAFFSLLGYLYKTYIAPKDTKSSLPTAQVMLTPMPTDKLATLQPFNFAADSSGIATATPAPASDVTAVRKHTLGAVYFLEGPISYSANAKGKPRYVDFLLVYFDDTSANRVVTDVLTEKVFLKDAGYTSELVLSSEKENSKSTLESYSEAHSFYRENDQYINFTVAFLDINTPEHVQELTKNGVISGRDSTGPITMQEIEEEMNATGYAEFREAEHDYPLIYYADLPLN